MATEGEVARAILAMAQRMEPALRAAFLRAVERLRAEVSPAALAALIQSGNVEAVLNRVLPQAKVEDAFRGVTDQAIRTIQGAAGAYAAAAPALAHPVFGAMEVRFNTLNPGTVRWLQGYETQMLQGFVATTRQSVTEAIRAGIEGGRNPLDTARSIPRAIGLTAQMERAAQNYERALTEGRMRDAAGYGLRDRRLGHSVEPDAARVARMVQRYRERALAHRAQTIARTESIRAANAGNHLLWEQQVEEGKVQVAQLRRKWIYTADAKVRHAHRTIPSMNPEGVGQRDAFRSELGPIMYPGDPAASAANTINCRCTVITRISGKLSGVKPDATGDKPKPKPRRAADPLGLKDKGQEELPWHQTAWSAAPKPIQQAIAKAPPVDVIAPPPSFPGAFYYNMAGIGAGRPLPAWAEGAKRQHFINMADLAPTTEPGRGVWRHEYGHHLDLWRDMRNPASRAATKEIAADAAALTKRTAYEAEAATEELFIQLRREVSRQAPEKQAEWLQAKLPVKLTDLATEPRPENDPEQTEVWDKTVLMRGMRFLAAAKAKAFGPAMRVIKSVTGESETDILVADFFGAITLNKVGYGHGENYYRSAEGAKQDGVGDGQAQEAFANYIAIMSGPSVLKRALFRAMAPKTTKAFDKIVTAMAKE